MNVLLLLPTALKAHLDRSLALKTLAWLGIPMIGVSGAVIAYFYHYSFQLTENQLRQSLIQHIETSRKRDSEIFQLAEANHANVKTHFQEQLKAQRSPQDFNQRLERNVATFDRTIFMWTDGTYRNFPQGQDIKTFPARQQSTLFIGPQVKLTNELKQQILLFQEFSTQYGRAFSSRYTNTWINGVQNISSDYRPDSPWGLEAKASTNILEEEYGYLADTVHNPTRKSRWTRLYFDAVPQRWMVSLVTPVDTPQGQHVATIGNDIILNELMDYTVRDRYPKSYNLIFHADGQLIVHPDRMNEIKARAGQLKLQEVQETELQAIFQQSQQMKKPIEIGQNRDFLWAITRLRGPDWFLVTVYPRAELMRTALDEITPLLILGGVALLTELFLLYQILRHHLQRPLSQLSAATEALSQGDFEVTLDSDRTDELGQLARSFSRMAEQLQASFCELSHSNDRLEDQVNLRTQELETTLNNLKLTQAQLIQSEKLSSLGEMVAGIAHEVNNPIGFVDGNLQHAERYMTQLLAHSALCQTPGISADDLAEHADHIDLAFIQQDLPKLLTSMQMGTDRIREIVLSLRNFSRLDEAQLKPADLHDGLDSTLIILHHRLTQTPGPPIQLEKNYGHLPPIQCYPGLLNQVFMNLISNAIDALEDTQNPKITLTTHLTPKHAIISIQDNGPGIPQSAQAHIFDPFFTTKEIGKGTGLGLSISHQIITEQHHGTIVCESSESSESSQSSESSSTQGTTFTLMIPLIQGEIQD